MRPLAEPSALPRQASARDTTQTLTSTERCSLASPTARPHRHALRVKARREAGSRPHAPPSSGCVRSRRTEILGDRTLVQLAHILTAEASDETHPARAWASTRHEILRDRTISAIERSIARGELPRDIDPPSLAAVILGAIEGVEAQWLVNPTVDVAQCARTLLRVVDALVVSAQLGSERQ